MIPGSISQVPFLPQAVCLQRVYLTRYTFVAALGMGYRPQPYHCCQMQHVACSADQQLKGTTLTIFTFWSRWKRLCGSTNVQAARAPLLYPVYIRSCLRFVSFLQKVDDCISDIIPGRSQTFACYYISST